MRALRSALADARQLAAPYFLRSEERASAWALLVSVIVLNLSLVGMTVLLNFWYGAFYDSLQSKDWPSFISLLLLGRSGEGGFMPGFSLIVVVYIPVYTYATYLSQWLQIRWRRWMTARLLQEWLSDRAYYRLSLTSDPGSPGSDNPDQRIADDIYDFVAETLRLGVGLLSKTVSLVNFTVILWTLSGTITLFGLEIPGYMLWVAILYAILGSALTHWTGRPLADLNFARQKVEADFRFGLVRLRENTEGVALYSGEAAEQGVLMHRFAALIQNWHAVMQRTKHLNLLIAMYEEVAIIFPYVVAAPRFFAGAIALGGLMRVISAFGRVQSALSWFVTNYADLAKWRATTARLAGFERTVAATRARAGEGPAVVRGTDMALQGATLALPDGRVLLQDATLRFPRGHSTVISGRSGSGKSTVFRALAGIWPFGAGTVEQPAGRTLFLPQRPYIPLGTLRHAVAYPLLDGSCPDAAVREALAKVGLGALAPELDTEQPWAQRLSGGEQQRLALARALLLQPDWLLLDEATASLDPEAETELYALLARELPDTTVISIAHRPAVARFHSQALVLRRPAGGPGTVEALPAAAAE